MNYRKPYSFAKRKCLLINHWMRRELYVLMTSSQIVMYRFYAEFNISHACHYLIHVIAYNQVNSIFTWRKVLIYFMDLIWKIIASYFVQFWIFLSFRECSFSKIALAKSPTNLRIVWSLNVISWSPLLLPCYRLWNRTR